MSAGVDKALFTREGRWEEAIEVLEKRALVLDDEVQRRDTLLQAASTWEEKVEDLTRAAAVYERVRSSDPTNTVASDRLEAIYTHFATADEPESPFFDLQRKTFEAALKTVGELRGGPPNGSAHRTEAGSPDRNVLVHAANSAATLRDARVWYDMVRPGLMLYGIVPPPLASTIPLKPVMSLTSRVVAVKGVRPC